MIVSIEFNILIVFMAIIEFMVFMVFTVFNIFRVFIILNKSLLFIKLIEFSRAGQSKGLFYKHCVPPSLNS